MPASPALSRSLRFSRRTGGLRPLAVLAVLAGLAAVPRAARADDAACIAASENELSVRKQGKVRAAITLLVVCAAPTCPDEIKGECGRRLIELNAALPTIVVRATDAAGNDLSGVTVSLDGAPLVLDGRPVPADPGNHKLRFEATGKPPVDKTVLLTEGEKDRRITVVVGDVGEPSGGAQPSGGGTVRLAGFAVGGAGVVGVVIGSVHGGLAISKSSSAKGECNGPGGSCTGNTNVSATHDMQTAGTFADASTGLFIAGGALAATGVVLFLTGGPKKQTTGVRWTPTVLAHGGAMGLTGAW